MNALSIQPSTQPSASSLGLIKRSILVFMLGLPCLTPSIASAQYGSQIQQLAQRQEYLNNQLSALKVQLGAYILANPLPSAALILSGVGAGAVIDENLDNDTKAFLGVMGLLGAGYCLDQANFQYCAQVASGFAGFANQINSYQYEINVINSRINALH